MKKIGVTQLKSLNKMYILMFIINLTLLSVWLLKYSWTKDWGDSLNKSGTGRQNKKTGVITSIHTWEGIEMLCVQKYLCTNQNNDSLIYSHVNVVFQIPREIKEPCVKVIRLIP